VPPKIYLKKDWDQALREREIVLALNPFDPVVIAMMAEMAIQAGRPDEAIASLRANVSWDTSQLVSSPHFRFGLAYFTKGDYRTALEHLKREPNLEPMYTLTFLAATYAELGQIDEARATVAKILRQTPKSPCLSFGRRGPFATKPTPSASSAPCARRVSRMRSGLWIGSSHRTRGQPGSPNQISGQACRRLALLRHRARGEDGCFQPQRGS
jgi:tetratricopeptide (TPR) repeat protein